MKGRIAFLFVALCGATLLASFVFGPLGVRAKGTRSSKHRSYRAGKNSAPAPVDEAKRRRAMAVSLRRQAYGFLDRRDYSSAIQALERSLLYEPSSYYAHYWIADSYYRLGYYDRAIARAHQALDIQAKGDAYLLLGMAYAAKDARAKSTQALNKALYLGVSSEGSYQLASHLLKGFQEGVNLALAPKEENPKPAPSSVQKADAPQEMQSAKDAPAIVPSGAKVIDSQNPVPLLPQPDELEIALVVDKGVYSSDEPVLATVTVTNRSRRLLSLPTPDFRANRGGSLNWGVQRPSGQDARLATTRLARWQRSSAPEQASLAPGQSFAYQCNLGSFYDLIEPGVYTVAVSFSWNGDSRHERLDSITSSPVRFRLTGAEWASPTIAVAVNGQDVSMRSQPMIARNRVLVSPAIVSAMGAKMKIESDIAIWKGSRRISFRLHHLTAYGSLRDTLLDVAPITAQGRILLPLRAMVEGIGGRLFWSAPERKASIVVSPDRSIARSRLKRPPVL